MLMHTHEARLDALRKQLVKDGLDGFVIPISDEHMSEYVGEYAQRVANHAEEAGILLRDILGGPRQFFREPAVLDAFAQTIVPRLLQAKSGGDQVRVWVIGCGTGEEAYTAAILLLEQMGLIWDVKPVPDRIRNAAPSSLAVSA